MTKPKQHSVTMTLDVNTIGGGLTLQKALHDFFQQAHLSGGVLASRVKEIPVLHALVLAAMSAHAEVSEMAAK